MDEPKNIYERVLTVNTFECDFSQRWKPAAFSQHLTETAVAHAAHLGVGFEELAPQNLFWVHSRMKTRFLRFPRAGEQITIHTWPKTIQQRLFYIRDFEVLDASGEKIAAATSAWLVVNASTRRLVPPQSLTINLPNQVDRAGLDEPLEKLALAPDGSERLRVRAGYSVVDLLGHVNNSRYVEWLCDCFPLDHYRRHQLDWLQINYDHEVLPGEEVVLLTSPSETDPALWGVTGNNLSNQTRAFEAALRWREMKA